MKRICAWCKLVMHEGNGIEETHGICPECMEKELEEFNKNHSGEI